MTFSKRIDPTKDSLFRSILFLSIPMVLEMVAQNVFNLVDVYFVSKIAYEAIGALVSSSIALMILFSISIGMSTATGMYIASFWGARKFSRAFFYYTNGFLFIALLGIFLSSIFFVFGRYVVLLMGLKGLTATYAWQYMSIASLGFLFNFIFNLNNSVLRSISLPSKALFVMILSNLLNIFFDPLFIFYFKLGIKGAALSTILSILVGTGVQFYHLIKNGFFVAVVMRLKIVWKIIKKGIFATFHLLVRIVSMLVLIRFVGLISQQAISAYSLVIRVYQVLLFIVFGLANTSFVIVGQNYGAKNYDRLKKGSLYIIVLSVIFISILDVLIYLSRGSIIGLFVENAVVREYASNIMFFYFVSYPFVVVSTIAARSSMALHDTKRPSLVNLFNLWFFMLPLAYFLKGVYGLSGIWFSIALSNFTSFVANGMVLFWNIKRVKYEGFVS